jgi:hypothetical protein
MEILFDTNALRSLREQARNAAFDVAGIGVELVRRAEGVALRELLSFRVGQAEHLAVDISGISAALATIAAHLEADAAVVETQILRAWWSQGGDALIAGLVGGAGDLADVLDTGTQVLGNALWLDRALSLVHDKGLMGAVAAGRRWRFGGHYDAAFGDLAQFGLVGAGVVANALGLHATAQLDVLGGKFVDVTYHALDLARHAATAASPLSRALGIVEVGAGAYSLLAGPDRTAWQADMAADPLRANMTYYAKWAEVGGQALMLTPFPVVEAVGVGLVGAGVVVEAGCWLSKPDNIDALGHDAQRVADEAGAVASKAWHLATPW